MSKARNLSDLLADGVIGSSEIADGAITEAKIVSGAITANKLQTGAAVPTQSGHSGKYLTTDGTTTVWATVDTSQGDTAFSWGDHSVQGYATTTALTTATANSSNWDTAFSWGNHASAGYAPLSNPSFTGTVAATSFSGDGSALTGIQAGDGHYLGRHRGKMNGGYYGGIGFTGLPVGKTLVVACLSMLNSTGQEFTAYTNSGGGSPGFQGGSWRKGQDKTNNSHQPVYFNYSGSNPLDRLDNESSAFSSNQGFSSRTMAFVQLTSSTASIPLYGAGRFEWVCDIYLIG